MVRHRIISALLLAGCPLFLTSPASAQRQIGPGAIYLRRSLCIELVDPFNPVKIPRVPVGCEVIDCCPGCPGPGPLVWVLQVSGDAVEALMLRFENLPADRAQAISIRGNAKWIDRSTLRVGKGKTVLTGIPGDLKERAAIAEPRLVLDKAAISRMQLATYDALPTRPMSLSKSGLGEVDFSIEQRLGQIPVREFRGFVTWEKCELGGSGGASEDWIRLQNMTTDRATVLLDGRRNTGCVDDEVNRAQPDSGLGNVLSAASCNSEVVVLSQNRAMQLLTPVTTWTDQPTDTQFVNMTPVIQAPVTLWLVAPQTQAQANNDVVRANQFYNAMQCGIGLGPVTVNNAANNPNAQNLLNSTCANAANLNNQIGFTQNQLNVYYVNAAGGSRGWSCGNNTIIVAASIADNETLSHELGHALSLGHTNNVVGMPATNVMVTGGTNRNSITTGQCFRCNANSNSALNANGNRTGSTRACPDATTSAACPSLILDVLPK